MAVDKEMLDAMRTIMKEEVRAIVKEELQPVIEGIKEIQHNNRDSHLYFASRLDHIQEDIRRLSLRKERAVR